MNLQEQFVQTEASLRALADALAKYTPQEKLPSLISEESKKAHEASGESEEIKPNLITSLPSVGDQAIALIHCPDDYPNGAWGKTEGGVQASKHAVDINNTRANQAPYLKSRIIKLSVEAGIHPALIFAIIGRESNFGHSLTSNGFGDKGNGFGIMQVDRRHHTIRGWVNPTSSEHITQGIGIFKYYYLTIQRKFPNWHTWAHIKGGFVAYNSGISNVATIPRMDKGTTGGDYGADCLQRAKIWKEILD